VLFNVSTIISGKAYDNLQNIQQLKVSLKGKNEKMFFFRRGVEAVRPLKVTTVPTTKMRRTRKRLARL